MSLPPRNIKLLHRQSMRFPVLASFESRSSTLHCIRETGGNSRYAKRQVTIRASHRPHILLIGQAAARARIALLLYPASCRSLSPSSPLHLTVGLQLSYGLILSPLKFLSSCHAFGLRLASFGPGIEINLTNHAESATIDCSFPCMASLRRGLATCCFRCRK
jgi:hypothetical protein